MSRERWKELRRRTHAVLEQGAVGDRTSRLVDRLLVSLIVVNLIAVALESVPAYAARSGLRASICRSTS